jgi:hypothetical protein
MSENDKEPPVGGFRQPSRGITGRQLKHIVVVWAVVMGVGWLQPPIELVVIALACYIALFMVVVGAFLGDGDP